MLFVIPVTIKKKPQPMSNALMTQFNEAWLTLNRELAAIEAVGGLGAALCALQEHQRRSGFIKDSLEQVERFRFFENDDRQRLFQVQFNPRRALRFSGSGISTPPPGIKSVHDGCFLCRDNIAWQQQGRELGYDIDVGGRACRALMNPFPLLPVHVIIASSAHVSQEWRMDADGHVDVARLLDHLCELASRAPGFIGLFNGVDAGASIPGHRHFHFFKRPGCTGGFPLEQAAGEAEKGPDGVRTISRYPLDVALWRGTWAEVASEGAAWVARWSRQHAGRMDQLTANFIAVADDSGKLDRQTLYFVPRHRRKKRPAGLTGLVGGLEVLGELVFSTPEEKKLLENGQISYAMLENALASVNPRVFA